MVVDVVSSQHCPSSGAPPSALVGATLPALQVSSASSAALMAFCSVRPENTPVVGNPVAPCVARDMLDGCMITTVKSATMAATIIAAALLRRFCIGNFPLL